MLRRRRTCGRRLTPPAVFALARQFAVRPAAAFAYSRLKSDATSTSSGSAFARHLHEVLHAKRSDEAPGV